MTFKSLDNIYLGPLHTEESSADNTVFNILGFFFISSNTAKCI